MSCLSAKASPVILRSAMSSPAPIPAPKGKPKRSNAYMQALAIQDRLLADILNPAVRAADRAQSARAWECIEDRKRILRGRPLPGQLRPDQQPKAMRTRMAFKSTDVIDLSTDRKESLSLPSTVPTPDPPGDRQLSSDNLGVPPLPLGENVQGKEDPPVQPDQGEGEKKNQ